ncbi:hypothetical protein NXG27_00960 [Megasphaera paucivorans]|uniref:Terminase-like family protein n=1 Tax=Megasphaera paucivorans TaxID=349095 RepID=A0A1G9QET7_9FIRM|nr:hypothetical protein [Megasphaera paucivorans]SDM08815.1 hypothetical protein SAMN05660299_00193 [Megasphaera paucivorans]
MALTKKEKNELLQLLEWREWKHNKTAFIQECCLTRDEADEGKVKHFPEKDYLKRVDKIITGEKISIFPKSRRMMMTWRCLANLLYAAMFNPNLAIFIQSKKFEDSTYLMSDDRLLFMYHHLPMHHSWPQIIRATKDKLGYGYIQFDNGTTFMAIAEGPDQLRQYTASILYATEMAFWEKAESTWNSFRPVIQGGGKIIVDSSANPGFFKRLVTGKINEQSDDKELESHDDLTGVHEYRRNGAYIARIHYTADPIKRDPVWIANEKAGATTEGWEREYEINWNVSINPKYYPEFSYERHVAKEPLKPLEGRPLERTWDYGLTPATLIAQQTAKGQLLILDELQSFDCGMRNHAKAVRAEMGTFYSGYAANDTGDPAGNQRSQADEKTANELLQNEFGIYVSPGAITQTARSEAVRYYLTTLTSDGQPMMLIDPSCTRIIEGFQGGYHRKVVANRILDEPEKNDYSHLMDCIGYLCAKMYGQKNTNCFDEWKAKSRGRVRKAGCM